MVIVYLEYYGLKEPPFNITPNPRFLFYSAKHREAFNHLLYGIRERKGFVQQMIKRLAMLGAVKQKPRIRRNVERRFFQPVIFQIHDYSVAIGRPPEK